MKTLPKVDLHLHLDCSLSYRAVSILAPSVTREEYERDYRAPAQCTNLTEFLSRAPRGVLLMQSDQALQVAVEDLFQQLVEDGIIYAEIRFAPLLHTEHGLSPGRVVEIVDAALERMISATGLQARLILCTLRHFTQQQSMATARLVEQFRGSRVVALDLAGDEAGFPIDAHIAAFRCAREQGCFRTAHAGEACGPQSVWDTTRELQPTRIGHGVRSIEDDALIEHLRRNQIHLEVCPSANIQIIESIRRWQDHPIDRLYRAGVSLNVNTDCRTLTPVTLTDEYEHLSQHFRWTQDDFLRTNLMGLRAAFVDEAEKTQLSVKLQAAYAG
jgi:adenosine deaminase